MEDERSDDQEPGAKLKTLKDLEEYNYWPKSEDKRTLEVGERNYGINCEVEQ